MQAGEVGKWSGQYLRAELISLPVMKTEAKAEASGDLGDPGGLRASQLTD